MTLSTSSQTLFVCVLFMKPGRTAALIDVVSPKFKIIPFERVGFIQQANNFVINFFLLKRLLTFPHTAVCLRLWKRARCCWMTLRLSVSDMYSSRAFSQRNLIQAFIFIQMDSGLFFFDSCTSSFIKSSMYQFFFRVNDENDANAAKAIRI